MNTTPPPGPPPADLPALPAGTTKIGQEN